MTDRNFTRLRFGERDEVLERFDGRCGLHEKNLRRDADQRERCEVARQIVGQLRGRCGQHDVRRFDDRDRVTVGDRSGDHVDTDRTGRTAAIVDDYGLADEGRETLADDACQRVGAAARRPWHDDANRFRRKVGGVDGNRRQNGEQDDYATQAEHAEPFYVRPEHSAYQRTRALNTRARLAEHFDRRCN